MNTHKYLLIIILSFIVFNSCSNEWDSHYSKQETEINNENVDIVDQPIMDYLKANPEFTSIVKLFDETEVFKRMDSLNLFYTVLVVENDAYDQEMITDESYVAKSHVTTASFSPSTLNNGQRVVMWNRKYVNVIKQAEENHHEQISFNGSNVKKVIKTKNGYVYVLESLIYAPKSLMEVIETLDDENFSIFKDMILSKNIKIFNKSASTPIGVDNTGNTIYDSVFTIENPYFKANGIDLFSESISATMLIPSNELITNAITEGKAKLSSWKAERQDSILSNWCFQVAFFKVRYTREDFENNLDLPIGYANGSTSANIFRKQWRTTINKVDLDNPIEMSNGIAYYMTELHIPKNVLMYRFKDRMMYYLSLTAEDKEKYFTLDNIDPASAIGTTYTTVSGAQPWTPWPEAGFPAFNDEVLRFKLVDYTADYVDDQGRTSNRASMEFTAVRFNQHQDGSYDIEPYLLPPGEYTFHFGMDRYSKYFLDVYINDHLQGRLQTTTERSNLGTSSGYLMDWYSGSYPEFFTRTSGKPNQYYDRNGRSIGMPFVVTGDKPVEIKIKFVLTNIGISGNWSYFALRHWCFMPTVDCY